MDILSNLYFGKICPQERAGTTEENGNYDDFINGLEPKLKEKMEEFLSSENLKSAKLEAEIFACGCAFATKFIFECLQAPNSIFYPNKKF